MDDGMSDVGMMHGGADQPQGAPAEDNATPMAEQGQPESDGATIKVPVEFLQGVKFEAGDELVVKVVDVDEDGSLEVAYAPAKGKDGGRPPSADSELDDIEAKSNADGGY